MNPTISFADGIPEEQREQILRFYAEQERIRNTYPSGIAEVLREGVKHIHVENIWVVHAPKQA